MTTYHVYRFVFPDHATAVAVALAAGVCRMVDDTSQEPDEDGNYPQVLETTVTAPIYDTLTTTDSQGNVVRTDQRVIGMRRADVFFRGENLQRQKRDAEGNLLTVMDPETGEPVPDMETLPGCHVDVLTNVPPETAEQQAALAQYAVTPAHPLFSFGEAA